ncbi:MAG: hypothetical protein IKL08_04620, partial [Clostridia bacterium]|nr:hypothetical protein [Clostridia bacterium]
MHAKRKEYSFSCREVNFFRSTMDLLIKDIKRYKDERKIILMVFSTLQKVETVKNAMEDNGVKTKFVQDIYGRYFR